MDAASQLFSVLGAKKATASGAVRVVELCRAVSKQVVDIAVRRDVLQRGGIASLARHVPATVAQRPS